MRNGLGRIMGVGQMAVHAEGTVWPGTESGQHRELVLVTRTSRTHSKQRNPTLLSFTEREFIGYSGNSLNWWEGWRIRFGKPAGSKGNWHPKLQPGSCHKKPAQTNSAVTTRN